MENINNDVYVVVFDSAGYSASVSICDPSIANSCARQLRGGGRKVRKMDYDSYCALLEKEGKERAENRRFSEIYS